MSKKGEYIIITEDDCAMAQSTSISGIHKASIHETIKAIKIFQGHHALGLDCKELRDAGRKGRVGR